MKLPLKSIDSRDGFSIRMTPLIDVVFLLMIFFIMTLNFLETEGVLENRLPEQNKRTKSDQQKDWEIVRIRLVAGEKKPLIRLQERVLNDFDELLHYLNLLPRKIMIVIDPDSKVAYKHVISAYDTCLKSKKSNIVFSLPRAK